MLQMLKTYADHYRYQQEGATAVEYGIMVALIAVVIIGVVTTIGITLRDTTFQQVLNGLTGAGT